MKEFSKTRVLMGNQLEDLRRKRNGNEILIFLKHPGEHTALKATIEYGLCNQEEINRRKIEKKTFSLKLLEICKTSFKKASPDMFIFYVVLAGHDNVNDAGRSATSRRKFKAPSLETKYTKNEGPFENMGFNGKSLTKT